MNCLHPFRTQNRFKSHEKLCKNKDLGNSMPSEMDNILKEFNQYMKPDKMSYIIYGHYKFLIKT